MSSQSHQRIFLRHGFCDSLGKAEFHLTSVKTSRKFQNSFNLLFSKPCFFHSTLLKLGILNHLALYFTSHAVPKILRPNSIHARSQILRDRLNSEIMMLTSTPRIHCPSSKHHVDEDLITLSTLSPALAVKCASPYSLLDISRH